MRTADIQPGKTYCVRLTELQSSVYQGCEVEAKVLRAGFHYDVDYSHGSRIRGAPINWTQRSEHPNGVEVEWERQQVPDNRPYGRRKGFTDTCMAGRAIVNARAVQCEVVVA